MGRDHANVFLTEPIITIIEMNGALTIGRIICMSSPVELRGRKLVVPIILSFVGRVKYGYSVLNVSKEGIVVSIWSWLDRKTKELPPSTKAAKVTGPAIGTRYS